MAIIRRGQEPANIKKRLDTLFPKLNEAYPDKVIRSLAKDHKKWAKTVTELYRALGYPDSESFLKAYGYAVERGSQGRPSGDHMAIIDELKKRYPNGAPFAKVGELQEANPDLANKFKTLANKSKDLFGMTLADYFKNIGLLGGSDHKKQLDELISELKSRYPTGSVLPVTLAQLKEDNADLMVSRINYTKEIYGVNPQEYLVKAELLQDEQKEGESLVHEWVELLLKRYDSTRKKPETLNALKAQNPDCPFDDIAAKIKKTGLTQKDFFINAGLIVENTRYTSTEEFLIKKYGPNYFAEDNQSQRIHAFIQTLTLNGSKKYSAHSVSLAAETRRISEYRAAYYVDKERYMVTMAVHILTTLREQGLAEISVNDAIELRRDTTSDVLSVHAFTKKGKHLGNLAYQFDVIGQLLDCKIARVTNGKIAYIKRPEGWINQKVIIATFDLVFDPKAFSVVQNDGKCLFEEKDIPFPLEECSNFVFPESIAVSDDYDNWGNAIARGLENDVDAAIDSLDGLEWIRPLKKPTNVPGIYQFKTEYPLEILEEFPALKVRAFYVDHINYSVSEVYSPSGCSQITECKYIGAFDPKADPSWYAERSPGKPFREKFQWIQTGDYETISYNAPFQKQWDNDPYYTIIDGKTYHVLLPATSNKRNDVPAKRIDHTITIFNPVWNSVLDECGGIPQNCEVYDTHFILDDHTLPVVAPKGISDVHTILLKLLDKAGVSTNNPEKIARQYQYVSWTITENDHPHSKREFLNGILRVADKSGSIRYTSYDKSVFRINISVLTPNVWHKFVGIDFGSLGINICLDKLVDQKCCTFSIEYADDWTIDVDVFQSFFGQICQCIINDPQKDSIFYAETMYPDGERIYACFGERPIELFEYEWSDLFFDELFERINFRKKGKHAELSDIVRYLEETGLGTNLNENEQSVLENFKIANTNLDTCNCQKIEPCLVGKECQSQEYVDVHAFTLVQTATEAEQELREAEERKRLAEEELKRKEAEEQKRREEEERKQKEAEARRIAEEKYQADLKSWEKACENIKKQREQAVADRLSAAKAALEQAAQKDYDTALSVATDRKKTAQQNKADAELRLSKLGLFKFTEKNAMKEAILQADTEITAAEKDLEQAKQMLSTATAGIPTKVFALESAIRKSVEEELTLPSKPVKANQ